MSYLFFFSYARQGATSPEEDGFFADLVDELIQLTNRDREEIGFRDSTSIQLGEQWPDALADALRTSKTFVCLRSARYFERPWCGKEWQVFSQRLRAMPSPSTQQPVIPPLMFPLLWVPGEAPSTVANIQYTYGDTQGTYATDGLRLLRRLQRHEDEYRLFLSKLAQRIVQVAKDYPIPDAVTRPLFAEVPNAFAPPAAVATAPLTLSGRHNLAGPRYAQFVYIVGALSEISAHRTLTSAYGNEPAVDWKPYQPPIDEFATLLATKAALTEKLNYEVAPVTDELLDTLREAEDNNKIVVLIVDPWSLKIDRYKRLMEIYDRRRFYNCVVVVPLNEDSETTLNAVALDELLKTTFPRQQDLISRYVTRSSDKFSQALTAALNEGRNRIFELLDVSRKAEGDGPLSKPTIDATRNA